MSMQAMPAREANSQRKARTGHATRSSSPVAMPPRYVPPLQHEIGNAAARVRAARSRGHETHLGVRLASKINSTFGTKGTLDLSLDDVQMCC
jgi:hypothetical protein